MTYKTGFAFEKVMSCLLKVTFETSRDYELFLRQLFARQRQASSYNLRLRADLLALINKERLHKSQKN